MTTLEDTTQREPLALGSSEGLGCNAQAAARERPVLFSAPMVRALLAGTKMQTRRPVKPQPETQHDGEPYWYVGGYRAWGYRPPSAVPLRAGGNPLPCPYGQPGDKLWVREAWARDDEDGQVMYRADIGHDSCADAWEQGRIEGVPRYKWRPSIHMAAHSLPAGTDAGERARGAAERHQRGRRAGRGREAEVGAGL